MALGRQTLLQGGEDVVSLDSIERFLSMCGLQYQPCSWEAERPDIAAIQGKESVGWVEQSETQCFEQDQ
jgi:hypothetical protein